MAHPVIKAAELESLNFYAVLNRDGMWFRRKGYGGSGDSWVNSLKQARIYNKIGPSRAVASWWASTYPSYGVPYIVEFNIGSYKIIDDEERFHKKQAKEQERANIRRIQTARETVAQAQRVIREAQKEL